MKKDQILECASKIIQKNGLQHLFMDEVAKQSGISKKTIYTLFENKEALLESLAQRFVKDECQNFRINLRKEHKVQDKVNFILLTYFRLMAYIPFQNMNYLQKRYPDIYIIFNNFILDISEQLSQIMEDGKNQQLIFDDLDVDKSIKMLTTNLEFIHAQYFQLLANSELDSWQFQIIHSFRRSVFKPIISQQN